MGGNKKKPAEKYKHKSGALKRANKSQEGLKAAASDPKQQKLDFSGKTIRSESSTSQTIENRNESSPTLNSAVARASVSGIFTESRPHLLELDSELHSEPQLKTVSSDKNVDAILNSNQKNVSSHVEIPQETETLDVDAESQETETGTGKFDAFSFANSQNASTGEKLAFLKLHPIQPDLDASLDSKRIYYRCLSPTETFNRKWISFRGENGKNGKMYCSICMAFGKDSKSAWCCGVEVNVKNIYSRIEKHEKSAQHSDATSDYFQNLREQTAERILKTEREKEVRHNREVIHRVVNIVLLLAKQNAAFRGTKENINDLGNEEENHGNFLETVKFLSLYDPIMAAHVKKSSRQSKTTKKGHTCKRMRIKVGGPRTRSKPRNHARVTFLSKTTIRKIIILLGDMIKEKIAKEVSAAGQFSLEIDSTQDCGVKDQMCICVRYVNSESDQVVQERFIKLVALKSSTGEAQHEVVKKEFSALNIDISNLVSNSFDGAANMSGQYKGLQARLKAEAPDAIFTHCHGHNFNLVIQDTVQCCMETQDLFDLLQDTTVFLSESYKRAEIFSSIVSSREKGTNKLKRLQKLAPTRWNSAGRSLEGVFGAWSNDNEKNIDRNFLFYLLDALHAIGYSKETDAKTASKARGLIAKWTSYKTILTAFLFLQIFNETTRLSEYLQTEGLDHISAWNQIEHLKEKLEELSDESNYSSLKERVSIFLEKIIDKTYHLENVFFEEFFPEKRKRTPKKRFGEPSTVSVTPESADDKYKNDVFKTVFSVVKESLHKRFVKNEKLLKALVYLDPRRFEEIRSGKMTKEDSLNLEFLAGKAKVDAENLKSELLQFAAAYEKLRRTSIFNEQVCTNNYSDSEFEDIEDPTEENEECNKEDGESSEDEIEIEESCNEEEETCEKGSINDSEDEENSERDREEERKEESEGEKDENSDDEKAKTNDEKSRKKRNYRKSKINSGKNGEVNDGPHQCQCAVCIFKFLKKYNYQAATYSTLYLTYKYVLTLACTQVTCERVFSKLKIVKNRLRSSMLQDLLEAQLLIAIERDCLPSMDKIIDRIALSSELFKKLLLY